MTRRYSVIYHKTLLFSKFFDVTNFDKISFKINFNFKNHLFQRNRMENQLTISQLFPPRKQQIHYFYKLNQNPINAIFLNQVKDLNH